MSFDEEYIDPHGECAAEIHRLQSVNADLLAALKALVADVTEYERINNLAPSPGKDACWQSVTNARAAILEAEPAQ